MKYTVKKGDTLSKISKEYYGTYNHYIDIVQANDIENPDKIYPGMELELPDLEKEASSGKEALVAEAKPIETFVNEPTVATDLITAGQLHEIMPKAKGEDVAKYLPALNRNLNKFAINTPLRIAHFIAQIAHESAGFKYNKENLNYSVNALRSVFGKYFPTDEMAKEYGRQPEKIANIVYANRMGNGATESGDGWKYRGRGLIQLTGKDNYAKAGEALRLNLLEKPDQLADDADSAVKVAGWYWDSRKLNEYADQDDVNKITYRINGGYNGLEDRKEYLQRAKEAFNV